MYCLQIGRLLKGLTQSLFSLPMNLAKMVSEFLETGIVTALKIRVNFLHNALRIFLIQTSR